MIGEFLPLVVFCVPHPWEREGEYKLSFIEHLLRCDTSIMSFSLKAYEMLLLFPC